MEDHKDRYYSKFLNQDNKSDIDNKIESPPVPISGKILIEVHDADEFLMIDEKKFTYQFFREFDVANLIKALEFYEKHKATKNLCAYCKKEMPECDGQPEFGTMIGNDNVIECPQYDEED